MNRFAEGAIAALVSPNHISYVWNLWSQNRKPGLLSALSRLAKPASFPDSLFVLSRLALPEFVGELEKCSAEQVPFLIQACKDQDSGIAFRAKAALHHLSRPNAISGLVEQWLSTRENLLAEVIVSAGYIARKPPSARVASCLLNNRLNLILSGTADMLDPLLSACRDQDRRLSEPALRCLPALQSQELIAALCSAWIAEPDPLLERAILQANYLPEQPAATRLIIALKTSRNQIGQACPAELLPVLLGACQSHDETIKANALACALSLNVAVQEALCARAIERGDEVARKIALQAGYVPQQPEARSLFLFLTEQWDEYQNFDFDQSILRSIYASAQPEMRKRLAEKIRSSGRLQFLDILSGSTPASLRQPTFEENETLIRLLLENKQFKKLWDTTLNFPPDLAYRSVEGLRQMSWRPDQGDDQHLFQSLLDYNPNFATDNTSPPFAVRRAVLRVHGRVNEVAFSPTAPWIAIGTGQGKLVLWDYQSGSIHKILSGFAHSIGQVAFTSSGTLVFGERTNGTSECRLYAWVDDQIRIIGSHAGSITAIEPLDTTQVLTAGRDLSVALWDLTRLTKVNECRHYTWLRHLTASHDRNRAVFLTDSLMIYGLPNFTFQYPDPFRKRQTPGYKRSVVRCATFSPDDQQLILGHNNGFVLVYGSAEGRNSLPNPVLTRHPSPVQQVAFLPDRPIIVTAGGEGQVRFHHWPSQSLAGTIDLTEGRLTTLHISPDGSFIATGTNEATMILWDTRLSRFAALLSQPLTSLTPSDLATINSVLKAEELPSSLKHRLEWLKTILTHHFRYDIQIDEAVSIQPGEFDILLE